MLVAAVLVAVLVVAAAITLPFVLRDDEPTSARDEQGPVDLSEVVVYDDLRTDHTGEDVEYEMTPPAGGPHDPSWLECGAYDEPVRDENVVHDLEHGTVWITYDPDLSDDDVAALEARLPENGILSPYPGLPAPVVVTVWERQLLLDGADDPRLELFVAELGGGVTAPEPFASCAGGIPDPTGGTGAGGEVV